MGEDTLARALARDPETADLDPRDRAMVRYAVRLTKAPSTVGRDDVEALREVGFSEAAVLDICQVTAYYNYVNRLADGLGVELEAWWGREELVLTREEFEARRGRRRLAPS